MTPKAQPIKGKCNKVHLNKIKTVCSAKAHVKRVKTYTLGENIICTNSTSGKGVLSRRDKEL